MAKFTFSLPLAGAVFTTLVAVSIALGWLAMHLRRAEFKIKRL